MSNILSLASYIYHKETIDIIRILKYLYFSFGLYATLNKGKYLFSEEIQAWYYGPVIPDVYFNFHKLPNHPDSIVYKEEIVLNKIFSIYKKKKAFDLVDITHEKGSPWYITFHEKGENSIIDKELIIQYYRNVFNVTMLLSKEEFKDLFRYFATH